MTKNPILKGFLFLISMVYGLGVRLRNWLYRSQLLKSFEFDIPVISVGNLSVGGSGKSPHTEYLIRFLKAYIDVATLSRGYGRKTRGFRLAGPGNTAEEVGDEPLQFARKFPDIAVAVSESRVFGVSELLMRYPQTQVILLDDAFQHRAIKPGLNILLTEYDNPFTRDFLLPYGRLREFRTGYQRADIIVVTKCPTEISEEKRLEIIKEIQPTSEQQVFFSKYSYQNPYYIFNSSYRINLAEHLNVLLVCAIARTDYLIDYVEPRASSVQLVEFEDHHVFTRYDLSNLVTRYRNLDKDTTIILTTEKDAMRLEAHREFILENQLPLFVLPVEVSFLFGEDTTFNDAIQQFLLSFKV